MIAQLTRWSLLVLALGACLPAGAASDSESHDWPQWLGPQRDAVWRETGVLEQFPHGGPPVRWRTPIGSGYSGPSVAGGRVFVMDRVRSNSSLGQNFNRGVIPGNERVICLSEADGKILWRHEYECPYDLSYPAGPRTTPIIRDGRVYAVGAEGNLFCLAAQDGKVIWSHEYKRDYNVQTPLWGFSSNPLLDGRKLICLVRGKGTTVVAFDKDTGREIWRALSAQEPGYSSPVIYEAGGKRQLIIWLPDSLNSLDPETGKLYWSIPFKTKVGLTVATPRQSGDLLFVSCFYNGPLMVRLTADQPTATELWRGNSQSERKTDKLHSIIATPFIEGGYIYGVDSYGQFRCLRADTGERLWETFTPTTGGEPQRWATTFIVKQGDRFFLPNEKGDLIIAKLSPKGYEEISRAHLLEPANTDPRRPVVWSHPAFANRCLYWRNDQEMICVSLAAGGKGE